MLFGDWFQELLEFIFPAKISLKNIPTIPHAPNPPQSWIFARFDYHNPKGKELIYFIKKYSNNSIAKAIVRELTEITREYLAEQNLFHYFKNPIIIPVPASKSRLKEFGFNQNTAVAKLFAQEINGIYCDTIIYKTKQTQKQALIFKKTQRLKNIIGSFAVNQKIKDTIYQKDIIIIDDLVTTGATVSEIKKVLLKNEARNVIAIGIGH